MSEIDKTFCWSFLGFFLAVVFGAISIYTTFFYERKPDLKLSVLGNTTVYDLREDVPKLDILFDNTSIKQSGQTLSIITAKVINDGGQGITKASYDDTAPLGLVVQPGKLISAEVLDASDPYLRTSLVLSIVRTNTISIAPVIIDAGEYFSVKVLVLHDKSIVPTVSAIGKIVGLKSIKLDLAYRNAAKHSWLHDVFAGGLWIQIARVFFYCVGVIGSTIVFGILAGQISTWRKARRAEKLLNEFTTIVPANTGQVETVKKWYREFGPQGMLSIQWLLSHKKELRSALDRLTQKACVEVPTRCEIEYSRLIEYTNNGPVVRYGGTISKRILKALLSSGFVKNEHPVVLVDEACLSIVDSFIEFLKTRDAGFRHHVTLPEPNPCWFGGDDGEC